MTLEVIEHLNLCRFSLHKICVLYPPLPSSCGIDLRAISSKRYWYRINNKAAIVLPLKSYVKIIAALRFVLYQHPIQEFSQLMLSLPKPNYSWKKKSSSNSTYFRGDSKTLGVHFTDLSRRHGVQEIGIPVKHESILHDRFTTSFHYRFLFHKLGCGSVHNPYLLSVRIAGKQRAISKVNSGSISR